MIVSFGAPVTETGPVVGDVVSQRILRLGNQPQQISFLRSMVNEYRKVYAIRARARDIVFRQGCCPPKDKVAHALAIGRWVQNSITYVEEKPETFQTPTTTIAQGYGDCDDFAPLEASLCEAVGLDTELVGLEWFEPDSGREYRHIFCRVVVGRKTIPLDATLTAPIDEQRDPVLMAYARHPDLRLCIG